MKVERFFEIINADFYTGVPDSQLKALFNPSLGEHIDALRTCDESFKSKY